MAVNKGKTVVAEIMTKQKKPRVKGEPPTLTVDNKDGTVKTITTGRTCRLLGGNFQEHLGWDAHLETGKKPLLPDLRRRLGQIRHLGQEVPVKTRLKLVNSLIIGKLIYLIPVWGEHARSMLTESR